MWAHIPMFPVLGKRRQEDSPGSMADQSSTVKEFHVPGRSPDTHIHTCTGTTHKKKKKKKKTKNKSNNKTKVTKSQYTTCIL